MDTKDLIEIGREIFTQLPMARRFARYAASRSDVVRVVVKDHRAFGSVSMTVVVYGVAA